MRIGRGFAPQVDGYLVQAGVIPIQCVHPVADRQRIPLGLQLPVTSDKRGCRAIKDETRRDDVPVGSIVARLKPDSFVGGAGRRHEESSVGP